MITGNEFPPERHELGGDDPRHVRRRVRVRRLGHQHADHGPHAAPHPGEPGRPGDRGRRGDGRPRPRVAAERAPAAGLHLQGRRRRRARASACPGSSSPRSSRRIRRTPGARTAATSSSSPAAASRPAARAPRSSGPTSSSAETRASPSSVSDELDPGLDASPGPREPGSARNRRRQGHRRRRRAGEACVESTGAYTYYPGGYLEPVITSISPSTGPNDASTRVTMFGTELQAPDAGLRRWRRGRGRRDQGEPDHLPDAAGDRSEQRPRGPDGRRRRPESLHRQGLRRVRSSSATTPARRSTPWFRSSAPWNQSTVVTIAGQTFEEPVEVTFEAGGRPVPARPSRPSRPPSSPSSCRPSTRAWRRRGLCRTSSESSRVRFPSIACTELTGARHTFTYSVNPMTAVSASPTQLNQAGGPAGSPLSEPAGDDHGRRDQLRRPDDGRDLRRQRRRDPGQQRVVANPAQLSFTAPAVLNSALNDAALRPAGRHDVDRASGTSRPRSASACGTPGRAARSTCRTSSSTTRPTRPAARRSRSPGSRCRRPRSVTAYGPVTVHRRGRRSRPTTSRVSGLPAGVTLHRDLEPTRDRDDLGDSRAGGVRSRAGVARPSASRSSSPMRPRRRRDRLDRATRWSSTTRTLPFTVSAVATTLTATPVGSGRARPSRRRRRDSARLTYSATVPSPALPAGGDLQHRPATGRDAHEERCGRRPGSSTVDVTAADTGCGGTRHEGTVTLTLNY